MTRTYEYVEQFTQDHELEFIYAMGQRKVVHKIPEILEPVCNPLRRLEGYLRSIPNRTRWWRGKDKEELKELVNSLISDLHDERRDLRKAGFDA